MVQGRLGAEHHPGQGEGLTDTNAPKPTRLAITSPGRETVLMRTTKDGAKVIDLRDAAPSGAASSRVPRLRRLVDDPVRHRFWELYGLCLLVLLNALDVLTTKVSLDRGGVEGNPFARLLIGSGTLGPTKALLLVAIVAAMYLRPPKLLTTVALWAAVAFYAGVLLENLYVIVAQS